MKLRNIFSIITTILLVITSCRIDTIDYTKPSDEIDISVVRYDILLDEYVKYNSFSALQKMNTEHIQATKLLIENIVSIGRVNESNITEKLKVFYSDTTLLQLMEDVETQFPDLKDLEVTLTKGFRNLHKEIPSMRIPQIYAQISALNESIIVDDTLLCISLDKYLGEDYPVYQRYYYDYQRQSMNPDRIAPDCFTYYLQSEYPFPVYLKPTLLNVMLHEGKINYVVKQLLEYATEEEVMGYSDKEKKWCKENQQKIWKYMVNNQHLHSTNLTLTRKYTGIEPIKLFREDVPLQVGIWLGSNIISSYMKHNKQVTLFDLLHITDYQRILESSQYNP
ncbi:hypothetical protein EZS27_023526 [termite gut metagenome]|uniref:Gliding motility lipoprotein GldB n=1 Tax=termite gut metagenome TaxID=433724 RepID=A0A5J4R2E8_9ZZZZ